MTVAGTSSVFAAVAEYFDNPRVAEAVRLTVITDDGAAVRLTPAQAHQALYGPTPDPALAAPIWQATLNGAREESEPSEMWGLLLIWFALPRLTGAAYRISHRLRADRADVEAEMVLGLLEGLRSDEPPTMDDLLKAVRSRAWRLARASARETASAALEHLADDHAVPRDDLPDPEQPRQLQVEVTRHEGTDGLRAQLRFTVSRESLGRQALTMLTKAAECDQRAKCRPGPVDRHLAGGYRRRRAGTR
ncbi:hypothetical protein ACWERV_24865 [Streptomyces sp. NPDC004031]